MFRSALKKELNLMEKGRKVGIIRINTNISFKNTIRPIIRNKKREIISIGRVNYALLDQFIISSLNQYYSNIEKGKDQKEKNRKIREYNELYQLWYKVNVARQEQDLRINSYYDDIVYRLYLLGYKN